MSCMQEELDEALEEFSRVAEKEAAEIENTGLAQESGDRYSVGFNMVSIKVRVFSATQIENTGPVQESGDR